MLSGWTKDIDTRPGREGLAYGLSSIHSTCGKLTASRKTPEHRLRDPFAAGAQERIGADHLAKAGAAPFSRRYHPNMTGTLVVAK